MVHDIEVPPDQFTYCVIAVTILLTSTTCSILFILQMTFERFYSIIKPHKAASVNTVKRAKIILAIIVISSVIFNTPHIFLTTHEGKDCVPWGRDMDRIPAQLHLYSSFTINFALPFVSLFRYKCRILTTTFLSLHFIVVSFFINIIIYYIIIYKYYYYNIIY